MGSLERLVPTTALPVLGVAMNRMTVARALGPSAAHRYRRDRIRARGWGPDARRRIYDSLWEDAAEALGLRVRALGDGLKRIDDGEVSTTVWFHHVDLDGPASLRAALDKVLTQRQLAAAGIPTAGGIECVSSDPGPATRHLERSGGRFVVKPARGTSSGEGVTCGLASASELDRAIRWASRFSTDLLVEHHAVGDEYRVLVLDGKPLDVVRRTPLALTGDGTSTVADLIAIENRRRERAEGTAGLSFVNIDLDTILTLDRDGLGLRSVPEAGRAVPVKATANVSGARESVHLPIDDVRALVADAVIAADAVGLRFCGVDVVTPDPRRPLAVAGGVVLEVNGTPGLHYHYLVDRPGDASAVAVPVLETAMEWQRLLRAHT